MTDLVGGQVLTMSETVPAALQFIQAGQLRPLAVTTAKRALVNYQMCLRLRKLPACLTSMW
nr:tripartite tricarboxylate transporter substrate-binding protein [Polynucleobacter necessarius]